MSYEIASSPSSRPKPRPTLLPTFPLTTPQGTDGASKHHEASKFTKKKFSQAFHHFVFPRRHSPVNRLERVAEAVVEDNAVFKNKASRSTLKRTASRRLVPWPSTASIASESTAPHISIPRPPKTFITSFPSLNVSDVPPRTPTNTSQFSTALLGGEGEEGEENGLPSALWDAEQLHRARLEKLTRHFGEEIPAGLVLSSTCPLHGASLSLAHSRRDGYHRKRGSLDHSSLMQAPHTEGILRRSKSLKEQSDIRRTMPMTGFTSKVPRTEYFASGVYNDETTINTVPISTPAPPPSTTPGTWHYSPMMNIPDGDVLHERVPMDTHSDGLPFRSPPPSVEPTPSEASPFSLRNSRAPARARTLLRRPATADSCQRVEKLTDFFGVAHDDASTVAVHARNLQFSPNSAAGDLALGIDAPKSLLEVEVKISKPARFWKGKRTTKNVHPDDVMDKLRMMKAS